MEWADEEVGGVQIAIGGNIHYGNGQGIINLDTCTGVGTCQSSLFQELGWVVGTNGTSILSYDTGGVTIPIAGPNYQTDSRLLTTISYVNLTPGPGGGGNTIIPKPRPGEIYEKLHALEGTGPSPKAVCGPGNEL